MIAYRLLQGFLRLVISIFFRNIETAGTEQIPHEGAVIFAGNHPNSLLDPLLVITHSGRIVHFAAKDVLFQSRLLRFVMGILGTVPVKRRQDHKDGALDNSSMFDALFKVLAGGGCMGIFPEGISHMRAQLAELKTGTARIALGVREKHPDLLLHIVPVGLTYLHRFRARSQVLVHFGEPLRVDDAWSQRHKEAPRETARALTDEIEVRLKNLTVNAPDWDTMRMLHTARRIYKPDGVHLSLEEYAELMRRFAEGYQKAADSPQILALREKLEDYRGRLDSLQLRDHDLRRELGFGQVLLKLVGRLVYLLILLPLAVPGFVLHLPVILTAIVAGDKLTQRKDVVGTTKLVVSILMVPLVYLAITALVLWQLGWSWTVVAVLALPLSGFATIRVLEQKLAVGRSFRALWRLFRFKREVESLRTLRADLEVKINATVEQLHDRSVPRIFSKDATDAPAPTPEDGGA